MAVDFAAQNGIPRLGTPRVLFQPPLFASTILPVVAFDVTPDGQRFILLNAPEGVGAVRPLTLITNWMADLKK